MGCILCNLTSVRNTTYSLHRISDGKDAYKPFGSMTLPCSLTAAQSIHMEFLWAFYRVMLTSGHGDMRAMYMCSLKHYIKSIKVLALHTVEECKSETYDGSTFEKWDLDSLDLASKIFLAEYPSFNGDGPSMGP